MLKPDYSNSIVNLVSSLTQGLGQRGNDYAPLVELGALALGDQPLVLLILDGLGDTFLQGFPESFLCRHRQGRLTSVFPPTTAAAVTSFFTGVAPQQHAVTGWHTYFKELGVVATVLPFQPRYGGSSFAERGISPGQLIGQDSLLSSLPLPCHALLPHHLVDSAYSRALSGRASRHGFATLTEMFSTLIALVEPQRPGLIIAYWPELDSLAHLHGMGSEEAAHHFLELDQGCRETFSLLEARGAKVVVTADHGLIDTCPEHIIYLKEHPQLAATLTLPLCGEPRCAYCYVHAHRRLDFERYVARNLGHACTLHQSSALIAEGYFGKGVADPRLQERVGDYVLLMKENYIIRDQLLTEKTFQQRGVHGGLSGQELYVPLIVLG